MVKQVKERAKVTYPYEAQHADELELKEGEVVTVLDKEAGDSGWWLGEVDGRKGLFPDNFVKMLPPEKEKVKKKSPAPLPARPASGPKVIPTETKPAPLKTTPAKPPPPTDSPAAVHAPPRRPSADAVNNAQPKMVPQARKPHPIAAPKPPKKVLPVPPKKPGVKPKAPPPKPAVHPSEREEATPPVILRHQPPVEKKENTEGGFEDLKTDSGQKLTHITLSRPKNANRRPPSVFGGQGLILSEARLKALPHDEKADTPAVPVAKSTTVVTSPTSPTNASQPPWVRELKSRSLKRPPSLAKEPQQPVENGSAVPPPRPKSSPIGPMAAVVPAPAPSAATPTQAQPPAAKAPAETSPAQSPAGSRPTSLVSDAAINATNAQVEELKKEVKSLQEQLSSIRSEFKKEVVNLMTELDEEKKHRMAMQVELDRLKKLVLEK